MQDLARDHLSLRSLTDPRMIDLHSHLLPGIDDGAPDLETALAMARMAAASGVTIMACTPHILPGVYHNEGPGIRAAVAQLQSALDTEGIALRLVAGADVHMVPDMLAGLDEGRLLSLNGSRYVLVEPPHTVAPVRLEEFFFSLQVAGYVPILTHPERLAWVEPHYASIQRLAGAGVWMQITSGSLTGRFGRRVRALAERMLSDGLAHILATDAHDPVHRPPDLDQGWQAAARLVGEEEAKHLVWTRPAAIVKDVAPSELPLPEQTRRPVEGKHERAERASASGGTGSGRRADSEPRKRTSRGRFSRRLRRLFD